jgi:hypothetical protein
MTGCKKCGKALSRVNVTGYCRTCFAANLALSPEREAARVQHLRDYKRSLPPGKIAADMRALSRKRLEWCPLEYRDDYRHLTRSKNLRAGDARALIEAQIAADITAYQRTGALPQHRRSA